VCSIRATNLIRLILVLVGLERVVFRFNRVVARFAFIIRGCSHLKLLLTNVCTSLCASSYTIRIPSVLLLTIVILFFLVTPDGSTGDELDSDGDVAMGTTGHTRKKSTKKSRTRSMLFC